MILTVGNKVVYPCLGPCLVSSIVEKIVADMPKKFYCLALLDDSGGKLFVPIDKAQPAGIRLLLKKSDIPKLLNRLMMTVEIARDRRQRVNDTLKRFTSGSAFDMADVVESLTELGKTKELTLRESWALTRSRKFLICEIAEVMDKTKGAAQEQVDQALEAKKIPRINRVPNYLPAAEFSQSL